MRPAVRKANGYFIPIIRYGDDNRETVRQAKSGSLMKYLNRQDAIDAARSVINERGNNVTIIQT